MKSKSSPPAAFIRFFRWFAHPDLRDPIEGDLMELHGERVKSDGQRKADFLFMLDIILLLRPGIIRPGNAINLNHMDMFKNYFTVGLRNMMKYKTFSFINVFGLSVAMSVCMLLMLMLADQHRYDQFHERKDRIYRILSKQETSRNAYATTPFPLATALKDEYPIVEATVSLSPNIGGDAVYGQRMADMRGYFTDGAFFSIFDFTLEKGDASTALSAPRTMVISRAMATQLFGTEEPIGKVIEFADRQLPFPQRHDGVAAPATSWGSFTVTGLIDETKYKSHLTFDVLISSATMPLLHRDKKLEDFTGNWDWHYRTYTYALLAPEKNEADLNTALTDLVKHKYASSTSEQTKGFILQAQPLSSVQLDLMGNDTDNRLPRVGYYFLGGLALVIMFSACLNYTNLSIARSLTRAREIGVRKVTGASRKSLVTQFLSESILTALLAMTLAVVLLIFIKPAFKGLWVNQYLHFELPTSIAVYAMYVAFALLIGIIAGVYPAFHLSSYQPVKALKHLGSIRPGKLGLRKVLSVTQFVISLFFITTSLLIFNQFKHFMAFDYGFQTENIVNVELQGMDLQKAKVAFGNVSGVTTISATDIIPATGRSNGIQLKKPGSAGDYTEAKIIIIDEHFLDNLGITLVAGKNIPASGEGSDRLVVVNESFVRAAGYKNPGEIIGQVLESKWGEEPLEVTGVAADFRIDLLINRDAIAPLVLRNQADRFEYVNVKIASADLIGTVANLEREWKKIDPLHPFKYEFFGDQVASTHKGIMDGVAILSFVSALAILIACLGLLGMATYTAERKKKEVGIRKVLGAADRSIALLLSREFITMLMIAVCIGGPLSYVVNTFWLEKFPNRVDFGAGTVLSGIAMLLALGIFTIASQTWRASRSNPVDVLKIE